MAKLSTNLQETNSSLCLAQNEEGEALSGGSGLDGIRFIESESAEPVPGGDDGESISYLVLPLTLLLFSLYSLSPEEVLFTCHAQLTAFFVRRLFSASSSDTLLFLTFRSLLSFAF